MAKSKLYAEGTTTSVESSRAEIAGILAKHGVLRQGFISEPEGDTLQFELDGHQFRLTIARPSMDEVKQVYAHLYSPQVDWPAKLDAEWRRRWRANVLLLKAKLEFADGVTSTVTDELMPYMLVSPSTTLREAIGRGDLKMLAAKN